LGTKGLTSGSNSILNQFPHPLAHPPAPPTAYLYLVLLLLPLAPTTTAAIITATTILLLSLLLYCCHHGYYPTANNLLFSPDQSLIRLCMITLLPFLNRIFPQSVTLPTLIYLSPSPPLYRCYYTPTIPRNLFKNKQTENSRRKPPNSLFFTVRN